MTIVIDVKAAESEEDRRKSVDHRGYFPYEANLSVNSGALHELEPNADMVEYEGDTRRSRNQFSTISN